jgi:hypothetical protein
MSDKFLPDISVGDLAMDILKGMSKDPVAALKPALKESTLHTVNAPDVSKIKVSDDYVSKVLGLKRENPKVQVTPIRESSESKLEKLVERLASLISEAKSLISEMTPGTTTVGNLGTNNFKIKNLTNKLKNKRKYSQ